MAREIEDSYYSYVRSVNIAELKNRLSHYLADVKAGREILIRDRDTPIAVIVPIRGSTHADEQLEALVAEGKIRLGSGSIDDAFWQIPAPRVDPAVLARAVAADRDED